MSARILCRLLCTPVVQIRAICTTTALKSSYLGTSLKNITYTEVKTPLWATHRFFSQKPEEIIVDFEHVKNATLNDDIYIVDVREPEEIKEHGKIPNSVNIPLGSVSTVLGPMADGDFEKTYKRSKPAEEDEIIFYCMMGKRAGMAQQNALNLGYKNVKNYVGSWTDWVTKLQ